MSNTHPVPAQAFIDKAACEALYDTCGDDTTSITTAEYPDGVDVDLYCPCFDPPSFDECSTTQAPTTRAPTTAAPVRAPTEAPTTRAPTEAPTTAAPVRAPGAFKWRFEMAFCRAVKAASGGALRLRLEFASS